MPHDHHDEPADHDLGLVADLATLVDRRMVLGLLAGAGLAALTGCGSGTNAAINAPASVAPAASSATSAAAGASAAGASAAGASAACEEIPQETAGPYPGDGSNGPNVLTQSGIVRSDIRTSFGTASGTAQGVPTTVRLTVQDSSKGCAALAGAAVYLWHCNRDGEYSMYSADIENENYLRGVQQSEANGLVTFQTIFPACYSGRWPHMHFEVYPNLAAATSAGAKLRTSQLALPQDACDKVYAADGYSQSVANLSRVTLQTDNVFGDGYDTQMATVTGTVTGGLTVTLTVPV
ncbi:MAG TPA: intradiol ring-cleavage dioxygenase [Micromonosporaceae bacterium]|jgi:protocatechuate 3,4-dioxygenase beta subunit|nr:intradiol ring-cleavage dioxygenase [Micromonosporaceae bacterium]